MKLPFDKTYDPNFPEPSENQKAFLERHPNIAGKSSVDAREAHQLIGTFITGMRATRPSDRQKKFLMDRGRWTEGMTRGQAYDLIGSILTASSAHYPASCFDA